VTLAELRLARVVALARRLADPADPLGREARERLAPTSGLSAEGLELALTAHLETSPSPADLDALVRAASPAPRCHLVLSANVCTAALRAVACAVASAPAVLVRPSRRDPALTALLVRELSADPAFPGTIAEVAEIAPEPGDEVHLYGSDASLAAIAARLPPGAVVRAHGTGLGVAVVEGAVLPAAEALARDVVAFDQRGCLSPRAALVHGGEPRALAFAEALHAELTALGARLPRGPLDVGTQAEITRYRSTLEALGVVREGPHHLVGLDPAPRALLLPPPARVVHVVPATPADVDALLGPWAPFLTVVGADDEGDLARAARALAPRARNAALGQMQRPPLDGPVDLRLAAPPAAGYRSHRT
jgi:hypothetical protein